MIEEQVLEAFRRVSNRERVRGLLTVQSMPHPSTPAPTSLHEEPITSSVGQDVAIVKVMAFERPLPVALTATAVTE
jgi:hypothetical protein